MKKGIDPEGIYFKIPELTCYLCEHVWFPRKVGKITFCPSCRSRLWNNQIPHNVKERKKISCPKCSHKWVPYSLKLSECPKCKKKLYHLKNKPRGKINEN